MSKRSTLCVERKTKVLHFQFAFELNAFGFELSNVGRFIRTLNVCLRFRTAAAAYLTNSGEPNVEPCVCVRIGRSSTFQRELRAEIFITPFLRNLVKKRRNFLRKRAKTSKAKKSKAKKSKAPSALRMNR